jgi:hypothetical protein
VEFQVLNFLFARFAAAKKYKRGSLTLAVFATRLSRLAKTDIQNSFQFESIFEFPPLCIQTCIRSVRDCELGMLFIPAIEVLLK